MPVKEIYLVRHGETDYNLKGIVQGRGVNSSINNTGQQQALQFFQHFKNEKFNSILVSSLQRTHQTMQPFVEEGYTLNIHEELDEINWGIHEGKITTSDLQNQYHFITSEWRKGNLNLKIENGESPEDLQKRQLNFIHTVLPSYYGKILICTHGRAMRSLLCILSNISLSNMDKFQHTNLSLYKVLQHENGNFEIVWNNYLKHLES